MRSLKWTVELEVGLFHAIHEHKPVGINRHFKMLLIHNKLNSTIDKKILVEDIWTHLTTLYDLQALHDSERLPFPNAETEFSLPETALYSNLKENIFPRYTASMHSFNDPDCNTNEHTTEAMCVTENIISSRKESFDTNVLFNPDQQSKHHPGTELYTTSAVDRNIDKYFSETSIDSPRSDQRKRTRQSVLALPSFFSSPTGQQLVSMPAEIITASVVTKRSRRI